jgi:hypothetical protein
MAYVVRRKNREKSIIAKGLILIPMVKKNALPKPENPKKDDINIMISNLLSMISLVLIIPDIKIEDPFTKHKKVKIMNI